MRLTAEAGIAFSVGRYRLNEGSVHGGEVTRR